jgi:putative redox protein
MASEIHTAHVEGDASGFAQRIVVRSHHLTADEPVALQGTDTGPTPHELLAAALGACTSMTVAVYARRKGWPLRHVAVEVTHEAQRREGAPRAVDHFERVITLDGDLDAEQRARCLEIANKCPVHQTLSNASEIVSRLA